MPLRQWWMSDNIYKPQAKMKIFYGLTAALISLASPASFPEGEAYQQNIYLLSVLFFAARSFSFVNKFIICI